ncbi:hypothetical protein D3C71_1533450 [compost metagenome]
MSKCFHKLVDAGGKSPLQRVHGRACRLLGTGVDQVGNRFGLRQIQLVIKEGTLGKFAGTGDTHAGQRQYAFEQQIEDNRPAVALQFQHVFAGKRVRARKPQRDALVQSGAFGITERQVIGVTRLRQFAEQGLGYVFGATAGNTQNADAAASRRGGLGYDGIGGAHSDSL